MTAYHKTNTLSRLISAKRAVTLLCLALAVTLNAGDLTDILKAGVLRAAVNDTRTPPFLVRNEKNEYQGFELDFLNVCAQELGVKLELVPADSYEGMVDLLASDKADVAMSKLSCTPARLKRVIFTKPYAQLHLALLVNRQMIQQMRGRKNLEGFLRAYSGYIMAIQNTSHCKNVLNLFPNAKLRTAENMAEVDELVDKRRLVMYLNDQLGVRSILNRHPGSNVFYQRIILEDTNDNICIALQPDSLRLMFFLNSCLDAEIHKINRVINLAK